MSTETIAKLVEATNIEQVWDIQCDALAAYRFDRLIYGYSSFISGASLGDMKDAVILTRHDPEHVQHFITEQMYKKGPMMKWASENTGACSWSLVHQIVAEGKLTGPEMEMMAINMQMGVTAGYTMSFEDVSSRSKGALALTAERGITQGETEEIWAQHGEDIALISKIAHLRITQLPHMNMRRPLTKRQSEVLQWVADGKTMRDISTIMGLNVATVEKHLKLARDALDVDSTAQAILKASALNQFFLVEEDD